MGYFISNTKEQEADMLRAMGYDSKDSLFDHIPKSVRLNRELDMPKGCCELELYSQMENIAEKNKIFKHIFRGAGAYRHYIPAIVKSVISKEEFITAYTPYQAEISQGNLQSIFEYQTMMCELTGLYASNASVYDGATAAAESMFMCIDRKKNKVLISETANPQVIETMKTYAYGRSVEIIMIPELSGASDTNALKKLINDNTACVYVQSPNYYGIIEDIKTITDIAHESGAKSVIGCSPIALSVLKTPAECNADIAVGEGQPLGIPLSYGGPYLGFMTATKDMMRKLPGRIVGETTDSNGKRGFVLTLQAREQHIRREKASSNICSNEALCTLAASVYLAAMGSEGIKQAAELSASYAHYLQSELEKVGYKLCFDRPFFNEFVTTCPVDAEHMLNCLMEKDFLGGLLLSGNRILWCATEMNSKSEIDDMISIIKEVQ